MESKQIGKQLGRKAAAILMELQDPEASYETIAARTGSTAESVRQWAYLLRSWGYEVPERCGRRTPAHARKRQEARERMDAAVTGPVRASDYVAFATVIDNASVQAEKNRVWARLVESAKQGGGVLDKNFDYGGED